jgi:hypothetical protein
VEGLSLSESPSGREDFDLAEVADTPAPRCLLLVVRSMPHPLLEDAKIPPRVCLGQVSVPSFIHRAQEMRMDTYRNRSRSSEFELVNVIF